MKPLANEEPRIQVYKSQEKAWTSNSKPGLPPAVDFVSELQKSMNTH